jgi:hypothetical protein
VGRSPKVRVTVVRAGAEPSGRVKMSARAMAVAPP